MRQRPARRLSPAILVAAQTSSGLPTIGEGRELEAIAAVVIGGTLLTGGAGSLGGTLAGVLLLKVIQNLINQVGTLSSYSSRWSAARSCSSWSWSRST